MRAGWFRLAGSQRGLIQFRSHTSRGCRWAFGAGAWRHLATELTRSQARGSSTRRGCSRPGKAGAI